MQTQLAKQVKVKDYSGALQELPTFYQLTRQRLKDDGSVAHPALGEGIKDEKNGKRGRKLRKKLFSFLCLWIRFDCCL